MRYILRSIMLLFVFAAFATVIIGLASYRWPVPSESLIVPDGLAAFIGRNGSDPAPEPSFGCGATMVDGVLYAVYWRNVSNSGAIDFEYTYGSFSVRRVDLYTRTATGGSAAFWAVAVVLIIPPLIGFRYQAWRRRRGFILGHCLDCGYDLKGNTSGICPECGSARGAISRKRWYWV